MRISARTGKNTRISMGPLGWLIVGPLIAAGYLLYWSFIIAVGAGALIIAAIGSYAAKKATVRKAEQPAVTSAPQPEDAVPPGHTPQRERAW